MLELLDYRRQVSDMYALIRHFGTDDEASINHFMQTRDDLLYKHPQSPLDEAQKEQFSHIPYWDYDPAFCVLAPITQVTDPQTYQVDLGDDGQFMMRQFGEVSFEVPTGKGTLAVYWIEGYGGGLFLPFRDATNNNETYGAGRYLYDTIKGADLGATETELILDFNYAYHPSCAYNSRWTCPLAPPQNHLDFPIPAGEQLIQL